MKLNCDLHCHSGHAGGVGNISLADIERTMPLKGIQVVGTGDCLQKEWLHSLKENLIELEDGLFSSCEDPLVKYVLQTEIIFTSPVGKGRKSVHHVLLFPSFESAEKARTLLDDNGVKLKIGRPFIKCDGKEAVADMLYRLHELDPLIESFPAHVMTPEGIYGSRNPVTYMSDFYGEGTELINAVETGLSADPIILGQIPELDEYGLISNSDAHSSRLHRMGREFTTLEVSKKGISGIIGSIRNRRISHTAEFHPSEGKYFLTGHRQGRVRHGEQYCVYSPKYTPADNTCPICRKKLTVGVLERSQILRDEQGGNDRQWGYMPVGRPEFVHMVPLIEVIAFTRGIRTPTSKTVLKDYHNVIGFLDDECSLWFMDDKEVRKRLDGNIQSQLLDNILSIKRGDFSFSPMGFDGTYGELCIGKPGEPFNVLDERIDKAQTTLDGW